MAQTRRPSRKTPSFDIQTSKWLVPAAFVFFLLALIVLFSDFVFSDQMLFGSDTLQQGYMFRHYLVDYVHQYGSIPRWIPYYFGGMPYIAAFHGDIFYPLTMLKYVFPLKRMLGWHLFMHIFLAGLFMYFCARQFRLNKIPSLLAGACYMFAAYLVSMVAPGHDGKIYVTAFFPLIILFLDRGFERRPYLNFTLLGMIIGLIILAPHAQMSYFSLWAVSFYAAFKLINLWRDRRTIVPLIKPAAFTTYAVGLGLLLSAIQFYPGYVYTTKDSPRAESKRGWEWSKSWSMHEEEAMSLLIPEFSGTSSSKTRTYYWGKNAFKDNSESVGTITLMLAIFGLIFYRKRESYFFGGLALFALIYALGATTPVFRLFFWVIPLVDKLRAPSMIMFMFSFSAAMLAAMGVQHLMNLRAEKRTDNRPLYQYFLFGFPGLLLLLALLFSYDGPGMLRLWTSVFYSQAPSLMVSNGVSKLDVAIANLPAIKSGAWYAFLFSALAGASMWLYWRGRVGNAIFLFVTALVVINGVRFDDRFVSVVSEREYQAKFTSNQLIDFFKQQPGQFRVLQLNNPQDNTLPFFDIDVTAGYHGNQLRWYNDLLGSELKNIRSLNPRVINLTNTQYIVAPKGRPLPYFGDKPLMQGDLGPQAMLVRNDNAFPRFFLNNRYRVYPDHKSIIDSVINGSNDLKTAVILEEEPPLPVDPDPLGQDSAWMITYEPDTVRIGVNVTSNRLLVLDDSYYDAWHATIDGQSTPILRAYGAFRAVVVPPGSRQVEFIFHSERYEVASIVTYVSTLYLIAVLVGAWVVYRRQRKQESETEETEETSA